MFKKIWKFLSGKKTALGMVLVIIAKGGEAVLPDVSVIWHLIENAGLALGGGGLAHKAYKAAEETN